MGNENRVIEVNVMPTVQWQKKKPVQIYISANKARPIRPELEEMINHEDGDIRNWARSLIEPFEICYISENTGESEFEIWKLFTPWMCTIDEEEDIEYNKIMSTPIPNLNVIGQIVELFNNKKSSKKWPEWLPIPLESNGTKQWMSKEKAKDVIIVKSSGEDDSTLTCDLSKAMFEAAKESGMRLYNLVNGFENLLSANQKIGTVSVEPPGASKIYENSVIHLIKAEKSDIVNKLLNQNGQTNDDLWPIFVKDTDEEVIMVSKPEKKVWNSTFLCLSDHFASKEKSIWSFNVRSKSFAPIIGRWGLGTPFYVRNLNDGEYTYSHLVSKSEGGDQICKAYKQIIQDSAQEVRFSYNEFHLTNSQRPNLGEKAFFNLGKYSHLVNTSEETKALLEGNLPPLPNILHSLKLPAEFNEEIPVPPMRKQRQNLKNLFSLNIQGEPTHNEGFARHIFRISGDGYYNNYKSPESIVEFSRIEKEIYVLQDGSGNNEQEISDKWQECIKSANEDDKNWSFIFRIITPSVAMIEHMITNDLITKIYLEQVFSLASLECMKPERFSPLNEERTQNFQTWYAYITSSGAASKKQRLQIEIARITSFTRSEGLLNQKFMLDDDIFIDYRSRAGFYTSSEYHIMGQDLRYTKTQKLNEIAEHVRDFWSASNNQNNQGGMLKLLKGACTGVTPNQENIYLPLSFMGAAKFQETLKIDARELNILRSKLTDCGIEFLFDKEVNEPEVFSWVFNPHSSSADWIISNLSKHAHKEPIISRLVEAIWNRQSVLFPNSDNQLLQRLGDWSSGISPVPWKDFVSEEFYKKMIQARKNTTQVSLYSKLRDACDKDEMERALNTLVFSRAHDYIKPNIWTISGLGAVTEKLFLTKDKSWFGDYYPQETKTPESTGFGLSQNVKWYPLSKDEFGEYIGFQVNDNHNIKQKILDYWAQQLKNCYERILQITENKLPDNSDKDYEIKEENLYLKDRFTLLLLGKYRTNNDVSTLNGKLFIESLPNFHVKYPEPDVRILSDRNVTLGPCGWDLKYDSKTHSLIFTTSKPMSRELMEKKLEILKEILRSLHAVDETDYLERRIMKRDFESEINGLELPDKFQWSKVDPLVRFHAWSDKYLEDLVEPNQEFLEHIKQRKWMDSNTANKVLSALENDARTWLSSPTEMGKIELQEMYRNQMHCTIPDFQNFVDSNSHLKIPLTVVRLHSGEGGSGAIGVLENNLSRSGKIGKNFKHIGNTLLVSSNAQLSGNRIDGWRLVGKDGHPGFLEYLDKNWSILFEKDEDLELIQIEEVVRTESTDEDYDSLANLWLHKLHILYLVSYYRATMGDND